jgi:hypothetical protein
MRAVVSVVAKRLARSMHFNAFVHERDEREKRQARRTR